MGDRIRYCNVCNCLDIGNNMSCCDDIYKHEKECISKKDLTYDQDLDVSLKFSQLKIKYSFLGGIISYKIFSADVKKYLQTYFNKANKKYYPFKTFHNIDGLTLWNTFWTCLDWVVFNSEKEETDEFKVKMNYIESLMYISRYD
jgi:hypothetical protein